MGEHGSASAVDLGAALMPGVAKGPAGAAARRVLQRGGMRATPVVPTSHRDPAASQGALAWRPEAPPTARGPSPEARVLCAAVVTAGLLSALGYLAAGYRGPDPHPAQRPPARPAASAANLALA
jgi:hypothetical protein